MPRAKPIPPIRGFGLRRRGADVHQHGNSARGGDRLGMLPAKQSQAAGNDRNAARQIETCLQALFHGSSDSKVHRLAGE